ncbi:acetolactate synthase 2 small subunit [Aliikangiella sp. IMCC44653]
MKRHVIQINADNQAATLEQLLRVMRYRGFKLEKVVMQSSFEDELMSVLVKVKSSRRIELLINQLTKLIDIKSVTLKTAKQQQQYAN